jgi:hypothetical protein
MYIYLGLFHYTGPWPQIRVYIPLSVAGRNVCLKSITYMNQTHRILLVCIPTIFMLPNRIWGRQQSRTTPVLCSGGQRADLNPGGSAPRPPPTFRLRHEKHTSWGRLRSDFFAMPEDWWASPRHSTECRWSCWPYSAPDRSGQPATRNWNQTAPRLPATQI